MTGRRSLPIRITALVVVLSVAACASIPEDIERTRSTAFDRPEETSLGRFLRSYAERHPGLSGFTLVRRSRAAFIARIGLADLAERSLDLQYYIWAADTTGNLLALKLLQAAERGVRVRILVDDNNLQDRDFGVAALDTHPNLEIRVFNPFANRGAHGVDFLTQFGRANHRMHNKVMIADGALAVVGGRNVGDHYFGVNAEANFRDLDIAATGPIVADIAASFDTYWNSEWAYPIAAVHDEALDAGGIAELRARVTARLESAPYPYPMEEEAELLRRELVPVAESLVWAQGRVVSDDPATLTAGDGGVVKDTLKQWFADAKEEVLIESAYFVPGKAAVEGAARMVERGVKLRVLTNSLASNDVAAAHAGYEKYRRGLLEAGVEIYELRPDAGQPHREWSVAGGRSIAALHTKALVVDRRSAFVGSFNLDPRSANINTEVGLLVDSPELAQQVAEYMDQGVEPENAYRVTLDDDGDLRWTAAGEDGELAYDNEPETSAWKRIVVNVIKVLPVESQL